MILSFMMVALLSFIWFIVCLFEILFNRIVLLREFAILFKEQAFSLI